jgi:hypothetical protein
MKNFIKTIFGLIIILSTLQSKEKFIYSIDGNSVDTIKETSTFEYPKSNAFIEINQKYYGYFQYRIAATSTENVNAELQNIIWKDFSTITEVSCEKPTISIHEPSNYRGCPTVFIDIFPWRIDNGNLQFIESADLLITIGNETNFPKISRYHPDIINKDSNNLIETRIDFSDSTQYLIITSSDLLTAGQAISSLYNQDIEEDLRINTQIVLGTDISNPVNSDSIRQYILNRIENNLALKYLLLLGDENVIPPIYSWDIPTDDYFSSSIADGYYDPQLATGRIPVSNSELDKALDFTDKLRKYVLEPTSGDWKNKVLLVADDEFKAGYSYHQEIKHTANSDSLYHRINQVTNIQTIYGPEYIPIPGSGGILQPQMNEDLLNSINDGVSLINYIGHGSPTQFAAEEILTMDRDLSLIHDPVSAIWMAGTCKFGWYDNEDAMSEALLLKPDGAISIIASSRNTGYTSRTIRYMFDEIKNYIENEYIVSNNDTTFYNKDRFRLGDMYFLAKTTSNEKEYHLFGDPAMPLPFPKNTNVIDLSQTSDVFEILGEVTVTTQPDYFTNNSYLLACGPEQEITRFYTENNGSITELNYILPGQTISQNQFSGSTQFFIPIDLVFCDTCEYNSGKITVFTENSESLNSYSDTELDIEIDDSQSSQNTDIDGPIISLIQNGSIVHNNGVIFYPHQFQVNLVDETGINLMGATGHNLCYWLDNEDNEVVVNDDFTYNSPTSGYFDIFFEDIEFGNHELTIKAWDNVNNPTFQTYTIYLSQNSNFTVEKVYNYPNPFSEITDFTFHLSDPADVHISIYTLEGRIINDISKFNLIAGYHSIRWNGLDKFSQTIANNTYLYTIHATNGSGMNVKTIHKLSKVR